MKKGTKTIQTIRVNDVVVDTAQPRQDWENNQKSLKILEADIEKNGLYYPIIVSPFYKDGEKVVLGDKAISHPNRRWWILDGERRWRCFESMGRTEIEAMVRTDLTLLEMMEIQFASNTKRLQVTIREMSKAVGRYREEYTKETEEYNEKEFIQSLCDLTGYSETYFGMVEAINRADDDMREQVLNENIGGYAPSEIERVTKDPAIRRGLTDAFIEKEGRPLSALTPRAIKYQLRDIEPTLDPDKKRELAKGIVNDFVNRGSNSKHDDSNFQLYHHKATMFRKEVEKWNLHGLDIKEISSLIGIIQAIYDNFLEARRLNDQVLTLKESVNITGKVAG